MDFVKAENWECGIIIIALLFSIGAAYFDLRTRKIPNLYNLLGLILFTLLRLYPLLVTGSEPMAWLSSLLNGFAGAGICFGLYLLFFAFYRRGGGGDLKLMTALGMGLGWKGIIFVLVLIWLWDALVLLPLRVGSFLVTTLLSTLDLKSKLELVKSDLASSKQPHALVVTLAVSSYLLLILFARPWLISVFGLASLPF